VLRREADRRKPRPGGRSRSKQSSSGRSGSRERSRFRDFVLYVEGARDRELLASWARRFDVELVRCIEQHTVILGGRQPARAVADFRKRGGAEAGLSGLIVLDRDHHDVLPPEPEERGLDLFVWTLRHIESYLLVPAAIRRMLGLDTKDRRIERFVEDHRGDGVHAKRILGAGGSLSRALGTELRAGEIARAMRSEDLHGDIHDLFREIGSRAGLTPSAASPMPEVVIRSSTARRSLSTPPASTRREPNES
jgi:hypothetical protein